MLPLVLHPLILLSILAGAVAASDVSPAVGRDPVEIAIVVNKANPIKSLTAEEVRRLFLRQTLKWPHGEKVKVAQLASKDPLASAFREQVLQMSKGKLNEYWRNLKLTRGLAPPRCYGSRKLLAYVLKKTRGGVGILERKDVGESLKVVAVFKVRSDDEE